MGDSAAQQPGNTTVLRLVLDRLRDGDPAARGDIIAHACERLRQLTRRMLRQYPALTRWEQTDDVLQNSVLRLHKALGEVVPTSVREFFTLAAAQIRRELIDLTRHHFGKEGAAAKHDTNAAPATDRPGPAAWDVGDETNEPTSLLAWSEFHTQVERLPDEEREAFSLHWYHGLQFVEMASVLNITERTTRRRWRSACTLLYRAMRGESPASS